RALNHRRSELAAWPERGVRVGSAAPLVGTPRAPASTHRPQQGPMNATTDILRGELERLFELDELKSLSAELLGLDPEQVGGTEGKGAFARALVERCSSDDALLALADAVILSKEGVDGKLGRL